MPKGKSEPKPALEDRMHTKPMSWWYNALHLYLDRKITRNENVPIAIAGVATEIQK